jgi:hypothetical protein
MLQRSDSLADVLLMNIIGKTVSVLGSNRPSIVNTNWRVTEDNSFGTHEFMVLREQLGLNQLLWKSLEAELYRKCLNGFNI